MKLKGNNGTEYVPVGHFMSGEQTLNFFQGIDGTYKINILCVKNLFSE